MAMDWILTDTTCFFLAGGTYGYDLYDFIVANMVNDEACQMADIVGHSEGNKAHCTVLYLPKQAQREQDAYPTRI